MNHARYNLHTSIKLLLIFSFRQLERMKLEYPDKKVALVTFGSSVFVWGDCSTNTPKSFNSDLDNYDGLIQTGRTYAETMDLKKLEESHG